MLLNEEVPQKLEMIKGYEMLGLRVLLSLVIEKSPDIAGLASSIYAFGIAHSSVPRQ